MEYLDKEGVQTLWSKVKTKVQSVNKDFVGLGNVSNDAQVKRSEMGSASGVATLDSNGKIPVEQLGNLDTVVAMVVTELPTTDIKTNKIYLVKDNTTEGDLYQEYLYVNNAWEKIGTHQSTVDLANYVTKDNAIAYLGIDHGDTSASFDFTKCDGSQFSVDLYAATETKAGLMEPTDKIKLDGIDEGANNYTLPIASAAGLGGIKLGSGLSATSDGTVNVSADVVAGSVEWDAIKNKPTLLIGNETVNTNYTFTVECNDDDGTTNVSFNADRGYIDVAWVSEDNSDSSSIRINKYGITLTKNSEIVKDKIFMTDGSVLDITAITTAELNEILV